MIWLEVDLKAVSSNGNATDRADRRDHDVLKGRSQGVGHFWSGDLEEVIHLNRAHEQRDVDLARENLLDRLV